MHMCNVKKYDQTMTNVDKKFDKIICFRFRYYHVFDELVTIMYQVRWHKLSIGNNRIRSAN